MRSDFTDVFPEVPRRFHEAVLGALEAAGKTERRRGVKKRALALVAAAAILGISAAAAYFGGWHEKVAQLFDASPAQQEQLSQEGAANYVGQSATSGGVTITALQTLGDKNGLYVLFHIKAPEGVALSEEDSAFGLDVDIEGERVSWNAQLLPDAEKPEGAENEHYLELWINNTRGADLLGKTITVRFSDLRDLSRGEGGSVVVPGTWELSWPLAYSSDTRRYDLDAAYTVSGCEVTVEKIELTPLSMTLKLGGEGLERLVERSDLNEAGGLCAVTVAMKDGTRFVEGPKNEFYADGVYTQIVRFSRVYDVEDIAAVVLTFYHEPDGSAVTVPLP
ncbi:MAG: DUF4179 domain-containing protein [Clostridiales bacterium]|nr:DUF4179 domain-containing protein [Clostridiales bacterium]